MRDPPQQPLLAWRDLLGDIIRGLSTRDDLDEEVIQDDAGRAEEEELRPGRNPRRVLAAEGRDALVPDLEGRSDLALAQHEVQRGFDGP